MQLCMSVCRCKDSQLDSKHQRDSSLMNH